jgi:hypothetical protein
MGDVFASVYNFHSPLSSKVKLSIQSGCELRFVIPRCWPVGYFFICGVTSIPVFVPIGVYLVFLRRAVVYLGFWWSYYVFWCHCV